MEEKKLYQRWWFWIIILAVVIMISITTVLLGAFKIINNEARFLARDIESIFKDATIYTSAGQKTIVLELNNWDPKESEKLYKMINTVKEKINNGEFNSYNKFVVLSFMNSSGKENSLFIRSEYSLPDFTKILDKPYIDFEEYESVNKTLTETMDSYTDLYKSIY